MQNAGGIRGTWTMDLWTKGALPDYVAEQPVRTAVNNTLRLEFSRASNGLHPWHYTGFRLYSRQTLLPNARADQELNFNCSITR